MLRAGRMLVLLGIAVMLLWCTPEVWSKDRGERKGKDRREDRHFGFRFRRDHAPRDADHDHRSDHDHADHHSRFDRDHHFDPRRRFSFSLGLGGFSFGNPYRSYYSDPYGNYDSLWYDVMWYDDPLWYGGVYGRPYYGDHVFGYGAKGFYGTRRRSPRSTLTYTGPNSYVYGQEDAGDEGRAADPQAGERYLEDAQAAFWDRDYDEALQLAKHAAVELPDQGDAYLLLAQAQFAVGKHLDAAETLHHALPLIPEQEWGILVKNYRDYYGKIGDYTEQLRALEAAVKENPTNPAQRFLLGYHYGFLGFPEQAARELGQAVELTQTDLLALRLLGIFAPRVSSLNSK